MDEIKSLLDEEIRSQIQNLSYLSGEGKEKSGAVEDLAKLYRLRIEETKTELEFEEKRKRLEDEKIEHSREQALKDSQLKEQIKDRYFRLGIAAAEIILPLIFYGSWMRKGLKFEETGTFTSTTFRGLFNRFRPTKK